MSRQSPRSCSDLRAAWSASRTAVLRETGCRGDPTPVGRRHTLPTTYYLTCPRAVAACSSLESQGLMAEMNQRLSSDHDLALAYRRAHERYLADRERLDSVPEIAGVSAGGMPDRVKCLHALVAHALAAGPESTRSVTRQWVPWARSGLAHAWRTFHDTCCRHRLRDKFDPSVDRRTRRLGWSEGSGATARDRTARPGSRCQR